MIWGSVHFQRNGILFSHSDSVSCVEFRHLTLISRVSKGEWGSGTRVTLPVLLYDAYIVNLKKRIEFWRKKKKEFWTDNHPVNSITSIKNQTKPHTKETFSQQTPAPVIWSEVRTLIIDQPHFIDFYKTNAIYANFRSYSAVIALSVSQLDTKRGTL